MRDAGVAGGGALVCVEDLDAALEGWWCFVRLERDPDPENRSWIAVPNTGWRDWHARALAAERAAMPPTIEYEGRTLVWDAVLGEYVVPEPPRTPGAARVAALRDLRRAEAALKVDEHVHLLAREHHAADHDRIRDPDAPAVPVTWGAWAAFPESYCGGGATALAKIPARYKVQRTRLRCTGERRVTCRHGCAAKMAVAVLERPLAAYAGRDVFAGVVARDDIEDRARDRPDAWFHIWHSANEVMQFATSGFPGAARLRPEEVRRRLILALLRQPDRKAALDGHKRFQGMRAANRSDEQIAKAQIDRDNKRLRNIAAGGRQAIPVPKGVNRDQVDAAVRGAVVKAAPEIPAIDLEHNDVGNLHVVLPTPEAFDVAVDEIPRRLEKAADRNQRARDMAAARAETVGEILARRHREAADP